MSQEHRKKALRQLSRAKGVMVKSLFSELRRAGFEDGDVIEFAGELLELLAEERSSTSRHAGDAEPLRADSGLPSEQAFAEILAFELRRATRDEKKRPVFLVMIHPRIPEWAGSDARHALQEALATCLVRRVRLGDPVARLDDGGYAITLVGAAEPAVRSLHDRVCADLATVNMSLPDALSEGVVLELRAIPWNEEALDAQQLLAACRQAPTKRLTLRPHMAPAAESKPQAPILLRRASDTSVVLALGGGAARAAAHIGVIQELRRCDIEITAVAGASAGTLVGAMLALGMDDDDILERFVQFRASSLYRKLRRSYVVNKGAQRRRRDPYFRASSLEFLSSEQTSFLSEEECGQFVRFFVGEDRDIASLDIPFGCLATDLLEGCNVSLTHGSLHGALRAACAVPGLFPPAVLGERLLIDGSTLAEVPIQTASSLNEQPVLAIHLERPTTRPEKFDNSLEIGVRTSALVHGELLREQLTRAQMLLSVPVGEYGWLDFASAREIAEAGRRAAATALGTGLNADD